MRRPRTLQGARRTRRPRIRAWDKEPTEKASKHASRYAYEVKFARHGSRRSERTSLRERIRAFFDDSGISNYRVLVSQEGRMRETIRVLLGHEGDLFITRLADLGKVFRIYRLVPPIENT